MRRPWALPLVPLYGLGLGIKNLLYDGGWLRVRRLRQPVISVGSLSAGGAGKTPVVMMLAELLERHGVSVDVLSRGYGRGSGVVEEVDAKGTAERFGDEPMEMARAGLRVFVGAERFEAGVLAEAAGDARVHLLDDGFQHRRLARALDVVLLTAADTKDWMLPGGDLRESMRALRRADVVVVRAEEEAEVLGILTPMSQRRDVGHPDFIRRERAEEEAGVSGILPPMSQRRDMGHPDFIRRERAEEEAEVSGILTPMSQRRDMGHPGFIWRVRRRLEIPVERPGRPVAFCGIARPGGFFAMLGEAGIQLSGTIAFSDHHPYGSEDIELLLDAARHADADGFVMTAKDAVKIPAAAMDRLAEVGLVWVAKLRVELVDEEAALDRLLKLVAYG